MTAASGQFAVVRESREFRLLFFAVLASALGTRLAVMALMVDVWDRTESGKWVAAVLVMDFVPMIVIGLLLGSLVDRWSRRGLMIGADLVRFAVFCALPFATSATMVVALAGVAGFATGFFRPAVYAGLPNLVPDRRLADANGLLQAGDNVMWMVGPLLGGVLLSVSGVGAAYWFNAGTFLVSALLIAGIAQRLLQSERALTEGHWRDLAAGFALVRRSRALLTVLVGWSLMMLAIGTSDVAEVELAKVAFDAGNFGLAALMAASGLGLLIGALAAGRATVRWSVGPLYVASLAAMAAGLGIAAISPTIWLAAIVVVAMGVGNGLAVVINSVLVQRGSPDQLRGRAFTLLMSVGYSVLFVGMLCGGFLSDELGARWTWGIASIVAGVSTLAAYALSRGADVRPVDSDLDAVPVVSGGVPEPTNAYARRE